MYVCMYVSSGRRDFVELPSEMLSSSSVDNAMSKVFECVLYTRTQLVCIP